MVGRITNNIIERQVTRNLQRNLKRLSQLQMQLSSSKQFSRPSDNPIDFAQALNLRVILSSESRYVRNIERGVSLLNLNDSNLGSMNEVIQRAREIALSGANDTLDPDGRSALSEEVDELLQQAMQLVNTNSGGVYIYAGNKTQSDPFELTEADGKSFIRYLGDQGERNYEIGQGATVSVLFNGIEAFLGSSGDITSTVRIADLTDTLDNQLASVVPPVTSGTFLINGETITVDITTDTLEDLQGRINAANADVIASIDNLGRLNLQSTRSIDVELEDGTSNILQSLGLHRKLEGEAMGAAGSITPTTLLLGLGIVPQGMRITVDDQVLDIDLRGATQISDVLTAINSAGLPINAYINADGSGIDISATQSVETLKMEDMSRVFGVPIGAPGIDITTTLAALGIATPLGSIRITNGISFVEIDLSTASTVGDVLDLINTNSEAGVQAVINEATNGIDIVNFVPQNDLTITEVGGGNTALLLGVLGSDLQDTAADFGLVGEGAIDQRQSQNIFKALVDLAAGLRANDPDQIDQSLAALETAFTLNNDTRATAGARTTRLELAWDRYAESEVFLTQLISENEDIDLAKTVTDLATQETVMQASLNSAARLLLPSLLDFLPI